MTFQTFQPPGPFSQIPIWKDLYNGDTHSRSILFLEEPLIQLGVSVVVFKHFNPGRRRAEWCFYVAGLIKNTPLESTDLESAKRDALAKFKLWLEKILGVVEAIE